MRDKNFSLKISIYLALVFLFLLGSTEISFAQSLSNSDSSILHESVGAISISDLIPELDYLDSYLDETKERIKITGEVERFRNELSVLQADADRKSVLVKDIEVRTFQQLLELEDPFDSSKIALSKLRSQIKRRIEELTSIKDELDKRIAIWETTGASVNQDGMSSVLNDRLSKSRKKLDRSGKSVQAELDALVAVLSESSALLDSLNSSLKILSVARENLRSQLFLRDGKAFYEPDFLSVLQSECRQSPFRSVGRYRIVVGEYIRSNLDRLLVHLALTIILIFVVIKNRTILLARDSLRPVFQRPLVFCLIVSLLFSFLIYKSAPRSFLDTVAIILIVPVVTFLVELLGRNRSLLIIGFAALYLVDRARELYQDLNAVSQAIFFIELLWATFLSVRLILECKKVSCAESKAAHPFLVSLVGLVGKIATVIFSGSAFAVLAGYLRLSVFIVESLLCSVYLGLILFVAHKLLVSVLAVFLDVKVLSSLNVVKNQRRAIILAIARLLGAIFLVLWMYQVSRLFGVDSDVRYGIDILIRQGFYVGSYLITIKSVLIFCFVMFLTLQFSAAVRMILREDVYLHYGWDQGVQHSVNTCIHYLLLLIGVLFGLGAVGLSLKNFAIVAGALSVGIGFGMQAVVGNLVSGLTVLIERPIKLGDFISLNNTYGTVTRIGMRSTTIQTLDDAEIIIPNNQIVSNQLINWTYSSPRARISAAVGVAYGTDVRWCMAILAESAQKVTDALERPPPDVLFKGFGESSLNFEVRVFIRDVRNISKAQSELLVAINERLVLEGVTVPFPQRCVKIINSVA